MDIQLDFRTILAGANVIFFVIIIPLIKYIWNNRIKEIDEDIKELKEVIAESAKSERKFWQGVFNRVDGSLKDINLKVNTNCRDIKAIKGTCEIEIKRLDERIDGRVEMCREKHK